MPKEPINPSFGFSKLAWIIIIFIVGIFLWVGHSVHIIALLPTILLFGFILLCPLMHFFMNGHHHDHDSESKRDEDDKDAKK